MTNHRCRNDYVTFKRVLKGITPSGIAVSDLSAEGFDHIIVAMGKDVTDLEIGDRVLMLGTLGQDYGQVPNTKDLYLTRQTNVVLVYTEEE